MNPGGTAARKECEIGRMLAKYWPAGEDKRAFPFSEDARLMALNRLERAPAGAIAMCSDSVATDPPESKPIVVARGGRHV